MSRRILVHIGEEAKPVGEIVHETDGRREHSVFTYDPKWQVDPHAFAISPQLPLSESRFHFKDRAGGSALPPVMMDGAPDSWGRAIIRNDLGKLCTELDYLLEADDWLRTGALRYFDEEGTALAPKRMSRIPRLASMDRIIAMTRQFEADPDRNPEHRTELMEISGSLGGARPKVSVVDDEGEHWIAKLPRTGDKLPVAKGEVLVLQLARKVGINAAESRLLNTGDDHPVSLIRRFDRLADGRRRPYMSAQTLLGISGADAGDYVAIVDELRQHGHNVPEQMAELHHRLMFTILVSNVDDHLRNHGFIYAGNNRWILSPAFDINPEPARGTWLKTAISEIHGFKPSIEAAISAAPLFEIRTDAAAFAAREMARDIRDSWRDLSRRLGMLPNEIRSFAPAFEHNELQVALSYRGTQH